MATQEQANLDGQSLFREQRSDEHAQRRQGKKNDVKKKTFTRWINVFLQRCEPPIEVQDLYTDIEDGKVLMALLEELSGCRLLYRFRPSSHRIFRLNNIAKALAFLDDRHVKLLSVDASSIADGVPSAVLTLIWNIILYFQIKEATVGLQKHLSSSLSSLSTSSSPSISDLSPQASDISTYSSSTLPSKGRKTAKARKYQGKSIKSLLRWVQRCTSNFGVEVHDFSKSWMSGLAFLALIKSIAPGLVDLRDCLSREPRENVQEAFRIAQDSLDIPQLLDPEDVTQNTPDEQSIITYVSLFLKLDSGLEEDSTTDFGSTLSIPEIPSFRELSSSHPDAQDVFPSQQKTTEQRLWKRWSTSSNVASLHLNGQTTSDPSSYNVKRSETDSKDSCNFISTAQPCHSSLVGLDKDTVDQEVWTWMENATAEQTFSQMGRNERNFSQSSEEGIYSLSALDSDEEDAFSYILDLNKEILKSSSHQIKGLASEATHAKVLSDKLQTGQPENMSVSKVLGIEVPEHNPGHHGAIVKQNRNTKRPFADVNQQNNLGNIDENGDTVSKDRRGGRGEVDRGVDKVRQVEIDRKICDIDEESEDSDTGKEDSDEQQEGGETMEHCFREEGDDGVTSEEEEGQEREWRADGQEQWENWEEEEEEELEEEEEDGGDHILYVGDSGEEESLPPETHEEEDEGEDRGRSGAMNMEYGEKCGTNRPLLFGGETGRERDGVFKEGVVERTLEISEFRERFGLGEGLAVIEVNPGDGFDKGKRRDTEGTGEEKEEGDTEEEEGDEAERAELLRAEEELRPGADEGELEDGDFKDFEGGKEGFRTEDVGGDESEAEKRKGEVRKVEEEDEEEAGAEWGWNEGEAITERGEQKENNTGSSKGFRARNQAMSIDRGLHCVREIVEVNAVFDQDEGTTGEGVTGVDEREEMDGDKEEDSRQVGVGMKDMTDADEGASPGLSTDFKYEKGEGLNNCVIDEMYREEIAAVASVEDEEGLKEHKLSTVAKAAGRGHFSDITQEEEIKMHNTNPHHHHHHYNVYPNWTSACSGISQSPSEACVIPDSLAASCGVTRTELEFLMALWILLYCVFIIPEINF